METLLVMIFYVWAIGGVIYLLDRVGDGERYFKGKGNK